MSNEDRYKRRIERERNARKEAEKLLEDKSKELYQAKVELEKTTQAALADKERRYATVFECSMDGIVIHDFTGGIVETNREFCRMVGYSENHLLGMNIHDLHPSDWSDSCSEIIKQIEMQGSHRYEAEFRRCDLSVFPAEIAATKFETSGESFVQGVVRDISKRNKTFAALREAKEQAEQSNQAKSTFLANMSHEIRTPLNGIIGVAELLSGTELSAEQDELAGTILTSGENLLDIINDVLDFSKIESEKLELESIPFSLSECVTRAFSSITGTASQKGIEVACFIDPDLPDKYLGDIVRLRQVIANLLGNASKFTEQGEIYLGVKPDGGVTDGKQGLEIEVRDTGIGIANEDIDKLFEKFTQVDASTTRKFGGTGLGLAISQKIVQALDGEIIVQSELGVGSSFKISVKLPIDTSGDEMKAPLQKLKGLRVLIVDDNATNRKIMTHQCQYLGLQSQSFESAKQALDFVTQKDQRFDIGLLDMQMPEMDGLELARQLRKISNLKSMPLVLATSLGMAAQGQEDWPFDGFVYKPILLETLETALRDALGNERNSKVRVISNQDRPVKQLKILIAEDNVINSRVAKKMLKKLGYASELASNGTEVLSRFESGEQYDVILMDGQMPDMDGIEATREIRKRFSDSKTYIIALTANTLKGDREKYIAAGMDDYLGKPLRYEALQDALAKV